MPSHKLIRQTLNLFQAYKIMFGLVLHTIGNMVSGI